MKNLLPWINKTYLKTSEKYLKANIQIQEVWEMGVKECHDE